MKKIIITLLTACVGGAVAIGAYKLMENKYVDSMSLDEKQKMYFANNPTNIVSSAGDLNFVQAAAAVTPAVVHIKTTYKGSARSGGMSGDMEDMFEQFFGQRQQRMQRAPVMASGSGVIISDDGYIVTNNHVVEDATDIDVVLNDKRSYKAKIIGRDPNTDLALIKVSATNLPIVKLGNSDNVQVGEWVLAVGYPFTLNTTVTAGIVSAKARSIGILDQTNRENSYRRGQDDNSAPTSAAIESFIQTDAAINRGNSGGALVNTNGELIGINAAIASQSGNYEGYGFAIPINLAKKVLEDFKEFGTVKRGMLGVSLLNIDTEDQYLKDKGISPGTVSGVYVRSVVDGSAAAAVGLKEGDIIKSVDGAAVTSTSELMERVARHRPGDKVQLSYARNGKVQNVTATLKGEESARLAVNKSRSTEEVYNKLGASFAPVNATLKQRYRINSGVVVAEVRSNGLFDQFEIPKGMIITSLNGKPVNNTDDVGAALSSSNDSMIRINGVAPDGSKVSYNFQVAD